MKTPSQKIIIYSASFDPISNFNTHIAQDAANLIDADIVYLLPSYYGSYGTFHNASDKERLHMCKLAVPQFLKPKYVVSDYELIKKDESSAYSNLEYFANIHPEAELFLLIDFETLQTFSKSYAAAKVKAMAKIICYKSTNTNRSNLSFWNNHDVIYLNTDEYLPSSESIYLSPKIDKLNPKVFDYINQYGTYAKAQLKQMLSIKKYEHCLAVGETASLIANLYNQFDRFHDKNEKQRLVADAYIAGIYHDICKELKTYDLIQIARHNLKIKWWPSQKVLHGPVGAWWLKNKFFINNSKILRAVAEHTIPASDNPPLLSKIIYLADRLEKCRLEMWGKERFDYFWSLLNNGELDNCFDAIKVALKNIYQPLEKPFVYPLKF